MSRAVLLIHERDSMRPTPSCLTISALQISRSYKCFTIMDYTRSIEWIILDLECHFYKYFCQFAYLLWSECWVLSDCESFNNKFTQWNWPKSCATCNIRQQFVNKSLERRIPDVCGNLLLQIQVLYTIIWVSWQWFIARRTHHLLRADELCRCWLGASDTHNCWTSGNWLPWDPWS